ncbi:ABC transporter ATP-binding protein [Natrinema halophilum]|uniref:ABC transporter ATP-binding protein n=1 Tax=Natrinema halophilum TaxID=1699371 RepID=UPI001F3DF408|nr:ABC transporter ATP-binding protein [Natrinema halophilum]UHQ96283.1 ABC transporter ATP-binding protein [Natrinema halophilum]
MTNLDIDNINTYYGESHVLQDLSLSVNEGEIVAILGRNGAGKTTTLKSVMGLTPPRTGEIHFNGKEITGLQPHEMAQMGIGFVPEDRDVFQDLSVESNITIISDPDTDWPLERIYDYFPRLSERKDNRADKLSGGEQQMLAIARALATDPDLLLMDEPSEGLAPVIVDDLREMVRTLVGESGITTLFTEQNIEFAFDIAERCYIINEGHVAWEGTMEELEANEEVIQKYITLEEIATE